MLGNRDSWNSFPTEGPYIGGNQGFLDLQDPLFQRRWNEGYKPALSNIANAAMYTNPMNAWWNLATRNR